MRPSWMPFAGSAIDRSFRQSSFLLKTLGLLSQLLAAIDEDNASSKKSFAQLRDDLSRLASDVSALLKSYESYLFGMAARTILNCIHRLFPDEGPNSSMFSNLKRSLLFQWHPDQSKQASVLLNSQDGALWPQYAESLWQALLREDSGRDSSILQPPVFGSNVKHGRNLNKDDVMSFWLTVPVSTLQRALKELLRSLSESAHFVSEVLVPCAGEYNGTSKVSVEYLHTQSSAVHRMAQARFASCIDAIRKHFRRGCLRGDKQFRVFCNICACSWCCRGCHDEHCHGGTLSNPEFNSVSRHILDIAGSGYIICNQCDSQQPPQPSFNCCSCNQRFSFGLMLRSYIVDSPSSLHTVPIPLSVAAHAAPPMGPQSFFNLFKSCFNRGVPVAVILPLFARYCTTWHRYASCGPKSEFQQLFPVFVHILNQEVAIVGDQGMFDAGDGGTSNYFRGLIVPEELSIAPFSVLNAELQRSKDTPDEASISSVPAELESDNSLWAMLMLVLYDLQSISRCCFCSSKVWPVCTRSWGFAIDPSGHIVCGHCVSANHIKQIFGIGDSSSKLAAKCSSCPKTFWHSLSCGDVSFCRKIHFNLLQFVHGRYPIEVSFSADVGKQQACPDHHKSHTFSRNVPVYLHIVRTILFKFKHMDGRLDSGQEQLDIALLLAGTQDSEECQQHIVFPSTLRRDSRVIKYSICFDFNYNVVFC